MKIKLIVSKLFICMLFVSMIVPFTTFAEGGLSINKKQLYASFARDGELWIGKYEARIGINHTIQDVAPYITEGNTVVSIKTISAIVNTIPEWNSEKQEIYFEMNDKKVLMRIGSNEATVNGQLIKLAIPPIINNNRTMVPLRFVSENLGGKVNYEEKDQLITIEFPPQYLTETELENFPNLEPFIIDGDSMNSLLNKDDRVIADIEYFENNKPSRGDLVIFVTDQGNMNIKRVIALEGETIEYKNDILYINGKPIYEPYLDEIKKKKEGKNPFTYDYGPITVPANEIFVLGDNRRFSKDSRITGTVKKDKLIGKVMNKYIIVRK